ncbi:hypothetical protein WJX74_000523 [Apatococcus lobatus]|uniref:Uncharacterized protein n=1 Tax=Apatococcus lobatus TaxID=904363 RepID=A0AAW1S1J7_9CHLO
MELLRSLLQGAKSEAAAPSRPANGSISAANDEGVRHSKHQAVAPSSKTGPGRSQVRPDFPRNQSSNPETNAHATKPRQPPQGRQCYVDRAGAHKTSPASCALGEKELTAAAAGPGSVPEALSAAASTSKSRPLSPAAELPYGTASGSEDQQHANGLHTPRGQPGVETVGTAAAGNEQQMDTSGHAEATQQTGASLEGSGAAALAAATDTSGPQLGHGEDARAGSKRKAAAAAAAEEAELAPRTQRPRLGGTILIGQTPLQHPAAWRFRSMPQPRSAARAALPAQTPSSVSTQQKGHGRRRIPQQAGGVRKRMRGLLGGQWAWMHEPDLPSFPPEAEDAAPASPAPAVPTSGFTPPGGPSFDTAASLRPSSPISFLANTAPSGSSASGNSLAMGSQASTSNQPAPSTAQPPSFTFGLPPTGPGVGASQSTEAGAHPSSQSAGTTAAAVGTHQPSNSAMNAAKKLLGQAASGVQPQQPSQVTATEFLSATGGAGTSGPSIPGILNGPTLQQNPAAAAAAAGKGGLTLGAPAKAPSKPTGSASHDICSLQAAAGQKVCGPTSATAAASGSVNPSGGPLMAPPLSAANPFSAASGSATPAGGFQSGPIAPAAGGLSGGFTFGSAPAVVGIAASGPQPAVASASASTAASGAAFTFGSTGAAAASTPSFTLGLPFPAAASAAAKAAAATQFTSSSAPATSVQKAVPFTFGLSPPSSGPASPAQPTLQQANPHSPWGSPSQAAPYTQPQNISFGTAAAAAAAAGSSPALLAQPGSASLGSGKQPANAGRSTGVPTLGGGQAGFTFGQPTPAASGPAAVSASAGVQPFGSSNSGFCLAQPIGLPAGGGVPNPFAGAPVTFGNAQQQASTGASGQTGSAANPFGAPSSAAASPNPFGQTPTAFGFGARPSQQAPSAFGRPLTQQPTAGLGAAGPQPQHQQPAPIAFGQPQGGFGMQPTQPGGMGGFGLQNPAQGGFAAQQPTQQPQNPFGTQPTQGGFGAGHQGPSGFGGQPPQQPQSGFPGFGAMQQPGFGLAPPVAGMAPGAGSVSPGVDSRAHFGLYRNGGGCSGLLARGCSAVLLQQEAIQQLLCIPSGEDTWRHPECHSILRPSPVLGPTHRTLLTHAQDDLLTRGQRSSAA